MKRNILTSVFALALATVAATAIVALLPASAAAYGQWDTAAGSNCSAASCHGDNFGGFGEPLHNLHTPMTPGDCNACHPDGGGSTPVEIGNSDNGTRPSCTGCHVGEGLRQHHRNAGAATCGGCHTNPETSAPEDTPPPYYGTTAPDMNDPCNPSGLQNQDENWDGNTTGLDNDGDLAYDGNDPDCQAPVPTPAAPDVKANGVDGPLTVARGEVVTVDVGLVCNDDRGAMVDYVAVVLTPFGPYHFNVAAKTWVPGLAVTATARCIDLTRTLLRLKLPRGIFTFIWAIDMTPDGAVTPAGARRDQVRVTVQ